MAVREERLRTTVGLRGSPAVTLSAWRGRSGRRYVVGIHDLVAADLVEAGEVVAIAVKRDSKGIAIPLEVRAFRDSSAGPSADRHGWIEHIRSAGATEMHLHRLVESEAERRAIAADLEHTGIAK